MVCTYNQPTTLNLQSFRPHPWTKKIIASLAAFCIALALIIYAAISEYKRTYIEEPAADTVVFERLGVENIIGPIIFIQDYHHGSIGMCAANMKMIGDQIFFWGIDVGQIAIPLDTDTPLSELPDFKKCF